MNRKSVIILSREEREILTSTDISNKISKNTKMKYQSGVNKFFRYCEARNLEPIPTKTNLCHFISETSREIQPTSANAYLSGISHHFSISHPGNKQIRLSEKLRNTVKGCCKTFSTPKKKGKCFYYGRYQNLCKILQLIIRQSPFQHHPSTWLQRSTVYID